MLKHQVAPAASTTLAPDIPLLKRRPLRGFPVTVYIPTEIYTLAQFKMARQGRKREMSELFAELLQEWLDCQK